MLLVDRLWKLCIQRQRKEEHSAMCSTGSHEIFNREIK